LDIRTAEKITSEFGKVLEQTSRMTYGAPESLLPQKKDLVKEAIRLSLQRLGPADEETRKSLAVEYVMVARFIPDQDAAITAKFQEALLAKDLNDLSAYGEPAMKIIDRITEESKALINEMREYHSIP
jgi:hypothetical protein